MRTAEHTRRDVGRSHFRFTASRESGSIRVLLAEDDRALAREFLDDLARAGGEVDVVRRGDHALDALVRAPVDVAVMDEGLPGLDGRQVCERLRGLRVWTPVLLLLAAGDDAGLCRQALAAGADACLTRPFSGSELGRLVRALWLRGPAPRPRTLVAGPLRFEVATRRSWRGGIELDLTTTERALLEVFMRHPGEMLERRRLMAHLWREDASAELLDRQVGSLRAKLDQPGKAPTIESCPGPAYRLQANGAQG